jgi:hypothetical protein
MIFGVQHEHLRKQVPLRLYSPRKLFGSFPDPPSTSRLNWTIFIEDELFDSSSLME